MEQMATTDFKDSNLTLNRRMPAEWEPRERSLMAWPVRAEAWLDGLDSAIVAYVEVANHIASCQPLTMVVKPSELAKAKKLLSSSVELLPIHHDDSWIRDNGPTIIYNNDRRVGISWRFNAWGNKYKPFDADNQVARRVLDQLHIDVEFSPLVMEGGSLHVDGQGTLLTSEQCLLAANRNPDLSKANLERLLGLYLGVKKVIWLGQGLDGDETDGHIDNIACFTKPGRVIWQSCDDKNDPNYQTTLYNRQVLSEAFDASGRKLETIEIPQAELTLYKGQRLALSYINFYPVADTLIVPFFAGHAKAADDRAGRILSDAYPGYRIVGIDGMRLIKGGGNVHCITQQVPQRGKGE